MINTVSKRVEYVNVIEYLISDATDEDLCGQNVLLSVLFYILLRDGSPVCSRIRTSCSWLFPMTQELGLVQTCMFRKFLPLVLPMLHAQQ